MIDTEGNFTAEFTEALPSMLGEDHKDFKGLDDTPSIQTLVKRFADTKSAYDKKLENIIQKPGEDADDAVKGDYAKTLRAELGIQDSPDAYEFPEVKDGEQYREGSKEYWQDVFKKFNISQEQATGLTTALHEMQRDHATKDSAAAEKQQAEDITSFDEAYPGDKKPEALRHAYAAIQEFGTDALKAATKEAKLFDNHDLKEWANHTPIANLPFFANVGKKAAGTAMPTGEPTKALAAPQIAAIAAANNKTVEQIQQIIAQFPGSWNDGTMLKMPK